MDDWGRRKQFGVPHRASKIAGTDPLHDLIDRALQDLEVGFRIDTDPDRPGDQRGENGEFAEIHVGDGEVLAVGNLPEHRSLVEPEQIRRAEDYAGDGEGGPYAVGLERALQDRELADE